MAASYTFEDHSGLSLSKKFDNPYDGLIEQCSNSPKEIQAVYARHRTNRNAQQKEKLLSPEFKGVVVDEILAKLEHPKDFPDYVDPRHCLVFWARPTARLRELIAQVQRKLLTVLPNLWVMPAQSLHMTALEVTHSLTAPEIDALVEKMLPQVPEIADFTLDHRARLVKPMLSFDAQAFALSFLPAAGDCGRSIDEDSYSYHHLRRDLYNRVEATGVAVASRYVVPSAHLTVGRYITTADLETNGTLDCVKMKRLIEVVDEINVWLESLWSQQTSEWLVGQERGLTYRKGTLWYGNGGETVVQGDGFV